jgi:tetratricopeptide (TPR) repeat protein
LVTYLQKYDELLAQDAKMKPEEKDPIHQKNQILAANAALQLLQASQNASNSDNQEELKAGVKYSEKFLDIMEKSSLMKNLENNTLTKEFTKEKIEEWITYAKVFRAQSYFNIEGTPESTIISAYEALFPTKYKGVAYNSLSNYYREKDKAKQNKYLVQGIEALKNDPEQKDLRSNFAFIHMQNLYNGGQYKSEEKDELKKAIQLIKDEFSDDDNAVNAYLMDGQMAFDEKKYDEAKKIYQEAIAKFPKNGLYKLPFGWRRGLIVPLVGDEPDFDGKFTRKNCNCAGSPFVHIDIAPCALVVRNWELCETDNNSNDFIQINKWDLIEYEEPSFDAITDWTIQTRLRLAKLKNGEEYQETQVFK